MNKNKKRIREQIRHLLTFAHEAGKVDWPLDVRARLGQPLRDALAILATRGKVSNEEIDILKIEVLYGVKS